MKVWVFAEAVGDKVTTATLELLTKAREIGSTVEVHIGSRIISRQLTAGDGYQASNERTMHFGLGTADKIDQLVVHWPSGETSDFGMVTADRSVHLIEGNQAAIGISGNLAK